jgi:hypothetical protein
MRCPATKAPPPTAAGTSWGSIPTDGSYEVMIFEVRWSHTTRINDFGVLVPHVALTAEMEWPQPRMH